MTGDIATGMLWSAYRGWYLLEACPTCERVGSQHCFPPDSDIRAKTEEITARLEKMRDILDEYFDYLDPYQGI